MSIPVTSANRSASVRNGDAGVQVAIRAEGRHDPAGQLPIRGQHLVGRQIVGRVVAGGEATEIRLGQRPSRIYRLIDQPDGQRVVDRFGILAGPERR